MVFQVILRFTCVLPIDHPASVQDHSLPFRLCWLSCCPDGSLKFCHQLLFPVWLLFFFFLLQLVNRLSFDSPSFVAGRQQTIGHTHHLLVLVNYFPLLTFYHSRLSDYSVGTRCYKKCCLDLQKKFPERTPIWDRVNEYK